jgi:hypothetical protein
MSGTFDSTFGPSIRIAALRAQLDRLRLEIDLVDDPAVRRELVEEAAATIRLIRELESEETA